MRLTMPGRALRQPRNPHCGNRCCGNGYCGYWSANHIRSARGPDANATTQPTPRTEHALEMATTPNPLTIDASLPSAAANAADAPSPGVRPRRTAANRDRRSVTGSDRVARRLRERLLFARYRGRHDLAARDELVERFLPLATQLARRYRRGAEPLDDLVQVASVGLLKAIDRFDPERGTAFSSFAVPTIAGELKR